VHQLLLIVSGNYSWLNWLTVALGLLAFSDSTLAIVAPVALPLTIARPLWFEFVLYALSAAAILLSIKPAINLFSRNQLMNYSWNPFHLINAYGAFGSVTRARYEIVIEGTDEVVLNNGTRWQEYGFKAKPGDPRRTPPQYAPYHLRLDWLMWFLPFAVSVSESGVYVHGYELWFMRFLRKLLENDSATLALLRGNPFTKAPPRYLRALFYQYRYTTWRERKESGARWERRLIGTYMQPISLPQLRKV
jgi:lipase maturation factor